jgi:hypothetical protein
VTLIAAASVTVQAPVPLQPPPLQPAKVAAAAGVAVSRTVAPITYRALQAAPQSMPAGAEVTVPRPAPARVTVSSALATQASARRPRGARGVGAPLDARVASTLAQAHVVAPAVRTRRHRSCRRRRCADRRGRARPPRSRQAASASRAQVSTRRRTAPPQRGSARDSGTSAG